MAFIYVDLGRTGAGDGSFNSPYLGESGFYSAHRAANPGDVIYFFECDVNIGDSLEITSENGDGAPGQHIVFTAYPGHTVYLNGNNWQQTSYLLKISANYVTIDGINMKYSGWEALNVNEAFSRDRNNITIQNLSIHDGLASAFRAKDVRYLLVDNVHIHHTGRDRNFGSPFTFKRCDDLEIRNCEVHDNIGEGCVIEATVYKTETSRDINVHHNKFYNNFSTNFYWQSIHDGVNEFHHNIMYNTPDSFAGAGRGDYDYWKVKGIDISTSETIRDGSDFVRVPIENLSFHDNLTVQCSKGIEINQHSDDPAEFWKDVVIEQNTFVNCDVGIFSNTPYITPINNRLRNNIFVAGSGQDVSYLVSTGIFATADYNCWYGGVPDSDIVGSHDLRVDPLLKDTSPVLIGGTLDPLDYVPVTTSPVSDVGIDTGWSVDFFNKSRLVGQYDMGFAESSGESPDPPDPSNDLLANDIKSVVKLGRPTSASATFGTLLQQKSGVVPYDTPQNFITLTFDTQPTPGSLLVAAHYSGDGVITPPAGWSAAFWLTQPIDDDEGGLFYKIAGPAEPREVTVTSQGSNEHVMTIAEFSGQFFSTPLDVKANSAYLETENPITVTTLELAVNNNLVVGVGAGRLDSLTLEPVSGGGGFSSEFNQINLHNTTHKWVNLDHKLINTTSPQNATWSSNNSYSRGHHAGIAVFKAFILVTHSLFSDSLESHINLGTPSLGTIYNIGANSISSESFIQSTTLRQIQQFIPLGLGSLPHLGIAKVRVPAGEDPEDIETIPRLGRPTIGQVHKIDPDNISVESKLYRVAFGQTHILGGVGIQSSSKTTTPAVTYIHALGGRRLRTVPRLSETKVVLIAKDQLEVQFVIFKLDCEIEVLSGNSSIE